jgi:predicted DNA-binding transcriptional regulator AlpA
MTMGVPTDSDAGIITKLAELPSDAILDECALARIFGVVGRTIRRMEHRHELPPSIKLRTKRCWRAGAVLDWIRDAFESREKEARHVLHRLNSF